MYLDLPILKVHFKKTAKDLSDNAYATFCMFFSLLVFIKAYIVGTHLNCIDKPL